MKSVDFCIGRWLSIKALWQLWLNSCHQRQKLIWELPTLRFNPLGLRLRQLGLWQLESVLGALLCAVVATAVLVCSCFS